MRFPGWGHQAGVNIVGRNPSGGDQGVRGMRLTLRTLLAYLDDILEPAQAKEIGQKIDESECASELVRRVREVVRRRRLTAPDIDGPGAGLDPNIVAEYLDNTLSSSSVTDVEKVCLDSDIHLAEVAACHQILTLVLGEAVDVPETTRARMYMLGPTGESPVPEQPKSRESAQASTSRGNAATASQAEAASATTTKASNFEDSVPDYLRRKSGWSRVLPYALVSLIAAIWLGSIVLDENVVPFDIWGDTPTDNAPNLVASSDKAAGDVQSANPPPAAGSDAVASQPATAAAGDEQATGVATLETDGIDPEPPQDEPGAGLSTAGPTVLPVAQPTPLPNPVTPQPKPQPNPRPTKQPTPQPKSPSTVPVPAPVPVAQKQDPQPPAPADVAKTQTPPCVAHALGGRGVLLGWDTTRKNWHVQAPDVPILNASQLIVPMPFRFELRLTGTSVPLQLLGDTAVRILPATKAAPASFELQRGQLVISDQAADDPGDQSRALGIVIGGQLCRLELLTVDTRCGIEVLVRQPEKPGDDLGGRSCDGRLYVTQGAVRFWFSDGKSVEVVGKNQVLDLDAQGRKSDNAGEPAVVGESLQPLTDVPSWLVTDMGYSSKVVRRFAERFADEFDLQAPVSDSIAPLVRDDQPHLALMAVKCLAQLEDVSALVQVLQRNDHEEARIAAINGLRDWLPRESDHEKQLVEELGNVFPEALGQAVLRLLWGYSREDVQSDRASLELVAWLEHEDRAVRDLAFYHVRRLTNWPYVPPAQRQSLVKRLTAQIHRDGGLVPAQPSAAP